MTEIRDIARQALPLLNGSLQSLMAQFHDALVIEAQASGMSAAEAAETFGVMQKTIRTWASNLGIPRFTPPRWVTQGSSDEEFRRLYHEGLTRLEMAQRLGTSPHGISARRRRLNLPPFERREAPVPDIEIPRDELREAQAGGLTTAEAAERFGVSKSVILRRRAEYGIAPFRVPAPTNAPPRREFIDRGMVRMMVEEGNTDRQIAAAVGASVRSIERIRRNELGFVRNASQATYTQAQRDQAEAMLDEGMSYNDIERTIGIPSRRLRVWFPGRGWTQEQTIEYRNMKKLLERLDGRAASL